MAAKLTIAVASGKGGTGKTTVSTNLACAASEKGYKISYIDCDVEEPNGYLFLKPFFTHREKVHLPVPLVDLQKCTGCGICAEICQFSAIICMAGHVMTFDNMCHACGGCMLACPQQAITEKGREIGIIEAGQADKIVFVHGKLRVGEAMSPPLIQAVRSADQDSDLQIVDVPPGTSCPVIAAIKDVDFVLMVTEPTPFGLNDLDLALDMAKELGIPHAVVINRATPDNKLARDFCKKKGVKILAEIPDDRKVAEAYSEGELIYSAVPGFKEYFLELLASVEEEVKQ